MAGSWSETSRTPPPRAEVATSPYDSPDYHALVRRIREIDRADEDSTLARLVTADWLQEQGEEERAEYIRLSVDLDGPAVRRMTLAQTDAMQKRRHRLFKGPRPGWYEQDVIWFHCGKGTDTLRMVMQPKWWSGWVASVRCELSRWLTHGPDICRRHPVREVVITGALLEDAQAIHREGQDFYYRLAVDGEAVSTPAVRLAQRLRNMALDCDGEDGFIPDVWPGTLGKTCLAWAESEADTTPGG